MQDRLASYKLHLSLMLTVPGTPSWLCSILIATIWLKSEDASLHCNILQNCIP